MENVESPAAEAYELVLHVAGKRSVRQRDLKESYETLARINWLQQRVEAKTVASTGSFSTSSIGPSKKKQKLTPRQLSSAKRKRKLLLLKKLAIQLKREFSENGPPMALGILAEIFWLAADLKLCAWSDIKTVSAGDSIERMGERNTLIRREYAERFEVNGINPHAASRKIAREARYRTETGELLSDTSIRKIITKKS